MSGVAQDAISAAMRTLAALRADGLLYAVLGALLAASAGGGAFSAAARKEYPRHRLTNRLFDPFLAKSLAEKQLQRFC